MRCVAFGEKREGRQPRVVGDVSEGRTKLARWNSLAWPRLRFVVDRSSPPAVFFLWGFVGNGYCPNPFWTSSFIRD